MQGIHGITYEMDGIGIINNTVEPILVLVVDERGTAVDINGDFTGHLIMANHILIADNFSNELFRLSDGFGRRCGTAVSVGHSYRIYACSNEVVEGGMRPVAPSIGEGRSAIGSGSNVTVGITVASGIVVSDNHSGVFFYYNGDSLCLIVSRAGRRVGGRYNIKCVSTSSGDCTRNGQVRSIVIQTSRQHGLL